MKKKSHALKKLRTVTTNGKTQRANISTNNSTNIQRSNTPKDNKMKKRLNKYIIVSSTSVNRNLIPPGHHRRTIRLINTSTTIVDDNTKKERPKKCKALVKKCTKKQPTVDRCTERWAFGKKFVMSRFRFLVNGSWWFNVLFLEVDCWIVCVFLVHPIWWFDRF